MSPVVRILLLLAPGIVYGMDGMTDPAAMPADTTTTSMMTMTFHTGINDALWWSSWTPKSKVAYVFTFFALVLLGISHRGLIAYMAVLERHVRKKNVRLANKLRQPLPARSNSPTRDDTDIQSYTKEQTVVRSNSSPASSLASATPHSISTNPWRLSVDVPRGTLKFISSGFGYLMMLAVMTGNVGYFFATLIGILIGEIAFGRFAFAAASVEM